MLQAVDFARQANVSLRHPNQNKTKIDRAVSLKARRQLSAHVATAPEPGTQPIAAKHAAVSALHA
jgi:hypothetical protein